MLTSRIMMSCMNYLLKQADEEKLECLCKLLTTIGQLIEGEVKENLDGIFKSMQQIVDQRTNKISSRVRWDLKIKLSVFRVVGIGHAVSQWKHHCPTAEHRQINFCVLGWYGSLWIIKKYICICHFHWRSL